MPSDEVEFDALQVKAQEALDRIARNEGFVTALTIAARIAIVSGEVALAIGLPGLGSEADVVIAAIEKALPVVMAKVV